ncbi:MAG TPA: family 1 glycosylhydrolase [Acidimicrobiales bacterium]|jgi:beta-glucosidase|nr:family 1 glycosylhydrolase [Acidimicrobiales bacterium]
MTEARRFPDGFRWGSATAAHQIEGGNANNDWWAWEHAEGSGVAEPSGDACDSWHRWADDIDVVASLGLDHYRFSVEWSRIEPAPGEWSRDAVDHYRRICDGLQVKGIEPVVTLHHFTTPIWMAERGGWANPEIVDRFGRFCHRLATEMGTSVGRVCTLNEPNIVATMGYALGIFPPGRTDPVAAEAVSANMVAAHRRAVEAVRAAAPGLPVGLTLSMTDYQPIDGGEDRVPEIRETHEDVFLRATAGDDFLGVQTYTRMRIGPDGWAGPEPGVPTLVMGYEYWPQALAACLRRAWDVTGGAVPMWVTENGIGTDDDQQRIDYVATALAGVLDVIADGIAVEGYTYWSLLDNFEWAFGYRPRFGLVEVDRRTFERRPKRSASWFSSVARANELP